MPVQAAKGRLAVGVRCKGKGAEDRSLILSEDRLLTPARLR